MNKQNLDFLTNLYNSLILIQTKGEDTIRMAGVLKDLYKYIMDEKQNYFENNIVIQEENNEETEE